MRTLALALLLLGSGCSAVLGFHQCNVASDCTAPDGQTAYCTSDHICTTDLPSDQICTIDPVSSTDPNATTIAAVFRLSGGSADKDTLIANGAALAVSEINIDATTRPLRLVRCDTQADPEIARKAMSVAVEKYGAVVVIGPASSSEVLALTRPGSSIPVKYGVPIISPSATAIGISSLGNLVQTPKAPDGSSDGEVSLVWRTTASDLLQAKLLASTTVYGAYPTATTVNVAFATSPYGQGLGNAFVAELAQYGNITKVSSQGFDEATTNPVDVAQFLGMGSPQVALVVADADAPSWFAALPNTAGLGSTQILLTDGAESNGLFADLPMPLSTAAKSLCSRVTGTGPGIAMTGVYNVFSTSYQRLYGNPEDAAFIANAYDATYAAVLAMAIVPPNSAVYGAAVADGLSRLSSGKQYNVGTTDFAAAYADLAMGVIIDLNGASGPIDFDPTTGDVKSAPFQLWSVDTSAMPPVVLPGQVVTPPAQ